MFPFAYSNRPQPSVGIVGHGIKERLFQKLFWIRIGKELDDDQGEFVGIC
jgi:hypothetical protein